MPSRPDAASATRIALTILAFCFVANMMMRGVQEAYAVFLLPISTSFDWGRAEVSGVYSLIFIVFGLTGPIVGSLFDRWGPLRLYLCGMLAAAAGLLLATQASQLWHFYLALGLLLGFGGSCVGPVIMAAFLRRWFREKLNTALALAHASQGAAILVLVPSAQYLIEGLGWRGAYGVLSALVVAVLLPLFALIPWKSAEAGSPDIVGTRRPDGGGTAAPVPAGPEVRDAVRMPAFWGIIASYLFTGIGMFTVSLQAPAFLISIGYEPRTAAEAFGLIGLLVPAGMIGFGWLGDRIGRRRVVLISYAGTLAGLAGLHLLRLADEPNLAALALFIGGFGATFGSRGPAISAIAASLFGGRSFGRIYGIVAIGMGGGSAIGAWLGGFLHDLSGGYLLGQSVAMVSIVVGAAPFVLIRAIARA